MIDTDKELEWVREDREDRHIGSISKHECVVDVDWVEELLTEVKRLRKVLELIAKEMPHDPWMHTLIKDVIGFEKWQAKEMIE